MRQLLLFLSVLFCAVSEGYAQSGENSSFLFDDYQEATVYLKNGRQVRNKMNYNLVSEKFYFIDERDGQQVKILSNVDEVNIIKFGERTFYPEKGAGVEILSSEPPFYVQYKGTARDKPKAAGYGGTSSVSNTTTYSMVGSNSGRMTAVYDPGRLELGRRYNVYWVEKKGKKKEIRNMKQFLKLNSDYREDLERYIKENGVKFDDAQQMLNLYIYADSLTE